MRKKTPMRALLEGIAAGAIGSATQDLFFRVARPVTPATPRDAFTPVEPEQASENALETTARRLVEGLAQRGPLDERAKERLGNALHYGFGAAWGGLYGLLRASYPSLWSAGGVAGFSLGVWALGDNLLLPALRVAGWPQRYPPRVHAFAAAAHLAYGAGVAGTLAAIDRVDLLPVVAAAALARGRKVSRRAVARSRALVRRDVVEAPRHFAAALARRARDVTR
jgi:hypothetical protein